MYLSRPSRTAINHPSLFRNKGMAKKNSKATEKTKPIKKELPMEDSDSQEESEERQSFDYVEEGENGFTFDEDPTLKMPQLVNVCTNEFKSHRFLITFYLFHNEFLISIQCLGKSRFQWIRE